MFILLYFFLQSLSSSMNEFLSSSSISYVARKEVFTMNKDFFNLLFIHLEERRDNNVYQNAKQDADYLKATQREQELSNCYDKLDLLEEQKNIIDRWIDAIQAQEATYSVIVFRMDMQCCFSLLMQLTDL